ELLVMPAGLETLDSVEPRIAAAKLASFEGCLERTDDAPASRRIRDVRQRAILRMFGSDHRGADHVGLRRRTCLGLAPRPHGWLPSESLNDRANLPIARAAATASWKPLRQSWLSRAFWRSDARKSANARLCSARAFTRRAAW